MGRLWEMWGGGSNLWPSQAGRWNVDKDLRFYFSNKERPGRGFKQGSGMIVYICGEGIGEWFCGSQL